MSEKLFKGLVIHNTSKEKSAALYVTETFLSFFHFQTTNVKLGTVFQYLSS